MATGSAAGSSPGILNRAAAFFRKRPEAVAPAALALIALLLARHLDIPLDDDWMYMGSVARLLGEGRLVIHDFASPVLVFHVLWGALFSLIGGLSYDSLRLSTLALAAAALWLTARAGSRHGWRGPALWLLLNPLFLLLSFTYMTDVPYLFWATLSALLYARAVEEGSDRLLLAGSAAAALAFLVRQVALAVPLCAAAALLLRRRRLTAAQAACFLPPALAAAGYYWWFNAAQGGNWAHAYYSARMLPRLLDLRIFVPETLTRLAASAVYLGLFTAPFTFRLLLRDGPAVFRELRGLLCLAALAAFFLLKGALPYFSGGGVICDFGVGITHLGDKLSMAAKPAGPWGSPLFLGLMTLAGALSVLIWCARWEDFRRAARENRAAAMLTAAGLLQVLVVLLCFDVFFDRYLLPLVPGLLLTAAGAAEGAGAPPGKSAGKAAYGVFVLLLGLWSFTGAWEYLAVNRAKWAAASQAAVLPGMRPEFIDNGYEWDAVHSLDRNMAELRRTKLPSELGPWDWTALLEIAAVSSFHPSPLPELVIAKAPYFSPLNLSRNYVYINLTAPPKSGGRGR